MGTGVDLVGAIPSSSRNASKVCTPAASRCQSGAERKHIPSGMCCFQKTSVADDDRFDTTFSCSSRRRHTIWAGTDHEKFRTVHQGPCVPSGPTLQNVHRQLLRHTDRGAVLSRSASPEWHDRQACA